LFEVLVTLTNIMQNVLIHL